MRFKQLCGAKTRKGTSCIADFMADYRLAHAPDKGTSRSLPPNGGDGGCCEPNE